MAPKKKRNRSKSNQRPVKSDEKGDELTELKAKCFDLETQNRLLTKKLNAANATARSQKSDFDAKLSRDWQKSAKILKYPTGSDFFRNVNFVNPHSSELEKEVGLLKAKLKLADENIESLVKLQITK